MRVLNYPCHISILTYNSIVRFLVFGGVVKQEVYLWAFCFAPLSKINQAWECLLVDVMDDKILRANAPSGKRFLLTIASIFCAAIFHFLKDE